MNALSIKKLLASMLGLGVLSSASMAITVTPNDNANTLGSMLMGSGVTFISASWVVHASGSAGTFTGGAGVNNLGIASGIVLTSGSAAIAGQSQTSGGAGLNNGLGGWAPLTALTTTSTFDATVLRIDFSTTTVQNLYFNYVFGSEEYNEWVNSSYNDVFGFFLNGTTPADNIALIPSTTIPVAINNVNNGSNSTYYRDNDSGQLSNSLQYDGFTTVLQAQVLNLAAGNHTIYLAVADAGDHILDSGVFIQANSIGNNPNPTVPDAGSTLMMLGFAAGAMGWIRRRKS